MRGKRYLIIVLCVLILGLPVFATRTYGVETAVNNVSVILQDYVVARAINYFVRFNTSQTLLGDRDIITIKFPSEVIISEDLRRENISLNGYNVEGFDYTDHILQILVPSGKAIEAGQSVEVGIASAVIRNPRTAGSYVVTVNTTLDRREVNSAYFNITDYEYSDGVSKPAVRLTLSSNNEAPDYEIVFKTSVNGRLTGLTDKIFCEFALGSGLPSAIDGQHITINGFPLSGQIIPITGRMVTLPLPAYLNIAPGEEVKINISKEAKITRPGSDYNTMKVWTSAETRMITSFEYVLHGDSAAENQTGPFRVIPTPDGMGVPAGYLLQIEAGHLADSNTMETTTGFILTFPQGTAFPETINKEYLKLNGLPINGIISNPLQRELIFTFSTAVSLQQELTIRIYQEAGIRNPSAAADYKMEIRPLSSLRSRSSSFFTIKTISTALPSPVETPPVTDPTVPVSLNQEIQLRINSSLAVIDGVSYMLDSVPVIVNDVTLVPLRFIATALGAEVDYVQAGQYATVEDSTKKIVLWVDSRTAKINDSFQMMTQPATLINDRLMVPLRFISENFGLSVGWNGVTETVTVARGGLAPDTTTVTAEEEAPPEMQYPIGYKAYIKGGNSYINLRLGPGTTYADVGDALPGEALTVLYEQDDWYRVRTPSGQEAWIAAWLVDVPR